MAKITVIGDAVVVTSANTTKEIEILEKYNPKALSLFEENEDGKKGEIFRVGTGKNGAMNKYGVTFDGVSRNGEGKASITMSIPSGIEDAVKYVADKFGLALANLNKVEAGIASALETVEAQQAEILGSITVA